jgi:large subunit ribosomal protein L6
MSRVGKKPVQLPEKVKFNLSGSMVTAEGAKGKLSLEIHPDVTVAVDNNLVTVKPIKDTRTNRALQGMTRSLIDNICTGVSKGFEKVLEIKGIGYRAEVKGKSIIFNLGYSHPIDFDLPEGITASVEKNTIIKLAGIDKGLLGQTAASIRMLRPPEPYKGKGIKYAEEYIQRKAGKTGTK